MLQIFTPQEELIKRISTLYSDLVVCPDAKMIEPNVVVLSDPQTASELLTHNPSLKVMALTEFPNFTQGQQLLQLGLKGYGNFYIHKTHLDQAIEMINSGNVWLYPSFMQELINHLPSVDSNRDAILDQLSAREKETAIEVAKGKSNKEIAHDLNITERTVKAHLSSIFEKTGLSDRFTLAMKIKE